MMNGRIKACLSYSFIFGDTEILVTLSVNHSEGNRVYTNTTAETEQIVKVYSFNLLMYLNIGTFKYSNMGNHCDQ